MTQPDYPNGLADEPEADQPEADQPAPAKPKRRRHHPAVDILAVGALLVVLAYLHTRVVRVALVTTGSMRSTINPGDRLLIHLGAYKHEPVQRGDVIAFWHDDQADYEVKRVVGVGGDTVAVGWGMVFLNGDPLDEPYIHRPMLLERGVECVLEEGELFVMGDNRNGSEDSRDFGPIFADKVLGRIFYRILPLERIGPVDRQAGTPHPIIPPPSRKRPPTPAE